MDKGSEAKKVDKRFKPEHERKRPVTLRLDPDVIAWFKKDGPGWQTRVNAALRKTMNETKSLK